MAFFENPHVPSGLSYDCNRHAKFDPFFSKSILPLLTCCIWELITFSSVSKTFLSLIRLLIHLPRTFSSFLEPVSQFQQSILEWRAFKFCSNDSHTTFSREDYNDFQSTCLFNHNICFQESDVAYYWPLGFKTCSLFSCCWATVLQLFLDQNKSN